MVKCRIKNKRFRKADLLRPVFVSVGSPLRAADISIWGRFFFSPSVLGDKLDLLVLRGKLLPVKF